MPPSHRAPATASALKTPTPKVSPKNSGRGDGSQRSAKGKISARKPKDAAKTGADVSLSDEAVLAAAEAAEAAQPHKQPTPRLAIVPDTPASPSRPPATPRTMAAALHVLEREKSNSLIPAAFFDLDEIMRDMIEALFFHTYAAEKGLAVTEVCAFPCSQPRG